MAAEPQKQGAILYTVGTAFPPALKVSREELPPDIKNAVRPLMKPDPRRYLAQWFFAWASIVAAIWIGVRLQSPFVTVAAILFIATRQNVLALLMHEQTHWLGWRSRWGDYFCELSVAFPLLVTLEGYRRIHLTHHTKYFTDDDPDYVRKQGKDWTFPQHMAYFVAVMLRDLSGLSAIRTLKSKSSREAGLVSAQFTPPRWLRPSYLAGLIAIVTFTGSWSIFALYWLLPLLTVLQGIVRLGAITEHKYNLIDPSVEESTPLIEPLWWERLLLPNLNFTMHVYHHWFPAVPFAKLPEVHRICREAGLVNDANVFRGYGAYLRFLLRPVSENQDNSMAAAS